jgi:hypothetical protein
MKCKLCLKEKPLRQSHIIPEFLYRQIYDDKHRVFGERVDGKLYNILQKGIRHRLLCANCELLIGRYENYFAREWYELKRLPEEIYGNALMLDGLDYSNFKLFHLSILWRASVAPGWEFQEVSLGPHEEKLRNMLLSAAPGSENEYRILGIVLLFPGSREIFDEVIITPHFSRIGGLNTYLFLFGGCAWSYVISKHTPPPVVHHALSQSGTMGLAAVEFTSLPVVGDLYKKLFRRFRSNGRNA